jgi:uncharacterized protein YndB with AHSA1/START domain
MTDETPTRIQQHRIEIESSAEHVWKSLTEAEELIRWFSEQARVTPGEGGTCWVSWGEGQEGESAIDAWQPGKRLLLRQLPPAAETCGEQPAHHPSIFVEYLLESRGNKTVLRIVQSGIPDAPDWEGYYDGTERGWQLFMLALKHYLERHRGTPRDNILIMRPVSGPLEVAWKKLTGVEGLGLPGSLSGPDSLDSATRSTKPVTYTASTSHGQSLDGEVLLYLPPKTLLITINSLNDALLTATFEEMKGTTFFYATLATFGLGPKLEDVRTTWNDWLAQLLP